MRILAVDTETSCLNPTTAVATEVAAVVVKDGKVSAEYSALIAPVNGTVYEAAALRAQHRTINYLIRNGASEHDAYKGLSAFLLCEAEGLSVWAHNAPFDEEILRRRYRKAGLKCDLPRFECSLALFKSCRRWGLHDCHRNSLDHVAQTLGIDASEGRHTALGDARITALCVERILRECGIDGTDSFSD